MLYASLALMMVTREGTDWPLWLFWIGLGLALVAARSTCSRRGGRCNVKAIVMAGGEGTRLRPLTSNQPKPMVPIVGKPCMEHILELLKAHGLEDVIVTVAFLPQAIRSYFGDGESLGLNISYSVEETPLGTAGSSAGDAAARRARARDLRRRALRRRPDGDARGAPRRRAPRSRSG